MDKIILNKIKKIDWDVLEEAQQIHQFPVLVPGWESIINQTRKILGKKQNNLLTICTKGRIVIYLDCDEWRKLGHHTLNRICRSPLFAEMLIRKTTSKANKLVAFTQGIFKDNLNTKTLQELLALYKKYNFLHGNLYIYAIIPVYLDMFKPYFSNYLLDYIQQKIKVTKSKRKTGECFSILSTPLLLSLAQKEERELLRLKTREQVLRHAEGWRFLGYNFEGPALPNIFFLKRWEIYKKKKKSIKNILIEMQKRWQRIKSNQNKLTKELKIDVKHNRLLKILRNIMYSKDYRKLRLVESYYHLEKLLKAISKKMNLSLNEVRSLRVEEMEFRNKKIKKIAKARSQRSVFFVLNGKLPGEIITGEKAEKIIHFFRKKSNKKVVITEIKGQTAVSGLVSGTVRIIKKPKDMGKMQDQDILVTSMTNPNLLPAIQKAKAIVTDTGGITCHAAIVSRELGIPCVVGTKMATKILKDGDRIKVDATHGLIKKL